VVAHKGHNLEVTLPVQGVTITAKTIMLKGRKSKGDLEPATHPLEVPRLHDMNARVLADAIAILDRQYLGGAEFKRDNLQLLTRVEEHCTADTYARFATGKQYAPRTTVPGFP